MPTYLHFDDEKRFQNAISHCKTTKQNTSHAHLDCLKTQKHATIWRWVVLATAVGQLGWQRAGKAKSSGESWSLVGKRGSGKSRPECLGPGARGMGDLALKYTEEEKLFESIYALFSQGREAERAGNVTMKCQVGFEFKSLRFRCPMLWMVEWTRMYGLCPAIFNVKILITSTRYQEEGIRIFFRRYRDLRTFFLSIKR